MIIEQRKVATVEVIEPLTRTELSRMGQLEEAIRHSMQSFADVGLAFMEIRDNRLYRDSHGTFEAYCVAKWGIKRNQANKTIAAAMVVANLGTIVPTIPTGEGQCRPLVSLAPEQQQVAWVAAVEKAGDAPVTAKIVSAAVAELFPKPESKPTDSEEDDSESAEPMTWQEALQAASRKKNITSAEFAHMLGVSSNTGDTRKALHAVARSSGYEIESLKDSFRVRKAPTGQDAIAEIFGGLSPSEKMAQLRRLSGDPDVMRIRGEKQTQEMRKGDKATALEAAAGFIEQAGHELHKYQTNFGAHFGWLSKAMKTEQGVSEVLSMIGRLDRIANDSVAYSRALNERTSDV